MGWCKLKKDCIKAENLSCCGVEYPMPERCFKPKTEDTKGANLLRSDDTPGSVAKQWMELVGQIIEACVFLREHNQSIPSEVIDYIKEAALSQARKDYYG